MKSFFAYLFAGSFVVGVLAIDNDAPGTLNSTIDYKILSVTPKTINAEFYLQESGTISFKGCLDYEVRHIHDMRIALDCFDFTCMVLSCANM